VTSCWNSQIFDDENIIVAIRAHLVTLRYYNSFSDLGLINKSMFIFAAICAYFASYRFSMIKPDFYPLKPSRVGFQLQIK
jgi:hypothetical protein